MKAARSKLNMAPKRLAVPDNEELKVRGKSLSPQVSRSQSPCRSDISDSGTEMGEDYTLLDGLRETNQMLMMEIQAILQQMSIVEKAFEEEKDILVACRNSQLQQKDEEISNLRSSMCDEDENILQLKKEGALKGRLIQNKSVEIDNLKKMIVEIQDKARKIQKKVKIARRKTRVRPTDHTRESPQIEETAILTSEKEQLEIRLATLDQELANAVKLIENQTEQMSIIDEDTKLAQAKLAEELNKASESMRKELGRSRELLLRNNEEMQHYKQHNKTMFQELSSVMSHLRVLEQRGMFRTAASTENVTEDEARENTINNERVFASVERSRENLSAAGPGTPLLQRGDSKFFTPSSRKKTTDISFNARLPTPHTRRPGSHQITQLVSQSEDFTRYAVRIQNSTLPNQPSIQTLSPKVSVNINSSSALLPFRQRSNQGRALSLRKGVREGQIQNSSLPNGFSIQTLVPQVGANINSKCTLPPIRQRSFQGKSLSSRGNVKRDRKN